MPETTPLLLSVVLLTIDDFQTIRRTVRALRAQTIADRIELVLVAPALARLDPVEAELEGFAAVRFVEVGPVERVGPPRAEGVRHATAPIVATAEDHAYPEPGWAEALVRAHAGPWAAVGPVMLNANPETAISCADFVISYGPWIDPSEAGPREHLPGHNSSYKRELLLSYGERLGEFLDNETLLHWDLRERGHQVYLEPAARVHHMNFGLCVWYLRVQFHGARAFAAGRSRSWPWTRRAMYVLLWPIPSLRRFRSHLGDVRRARRFHKLPPQTPALLLLGIVADGIGQMLAYAGGAGDSRQWISRHEFHRDRFQPKAAIQPGRARATEAQ